MTKPKKIKFDEIVAKVHQKHWGQTRNRLDQLAIPYILHPLDVIRLLHSWKIGQEKFEYVWNAALCHDIEEDAKGDQAEWLEENIGKKAAGIVLELTHYPKKIDKAEYLKTFDKSSIEALVIKIADRICNTSDSMPLGRDKAAKVFTKAADLWVAFFDRRTEIEEFFGKETLNLININVLTFNGIFRDEVASALLPKPATIENSKEKNAEN